MDLFRDELPSQQFNTWTRPLQAEAKGDELCVYTPNRLVLDWVSEKYFGRLLELLGEHGGGQLLAFSLLIGSKCSRASRAAIAPSQTHVAPPPPVAPPLAPVQPVSATPMVVSREKLPPVTVAPSVLSDPYGSEEPSTSLLAAAMPAGVALAVRTEYNVQVEGVLRYTNYLNRTFTLENFIGDESNQLVYAVTWQVTDNLEHSCNSLFLYGGVGLGKTYLMRAVSNHPLKKNPNAKVIYLHSKRFVASMMKVLQFNAINELKRFYRSVDALLIDDVRFFARKERPQEELFHTSNALLEGDQQAVLTSDRYPKKIESLEERPKSHFSWGPTVTVEPLELETRVAILMKKAEQTKIELPHDTAFLIARRIRSSVCELEGTLKRVIAHLHSMGRPITIELIRESLKDLLVLQDELVSIDSIQHTVAEYYKIRISDLLSRRRSRSVVRPRQVAMALSKEPTNHSLLETGVAFDDRDHTTVPHVCRKVAQLRKSDADIRKDCKNLLRTLTT